MLFNDIIIHKYSTTKLHTVYKWTAMAQGSHSNLAVGIAGNCSQMANSGSKRSKLDKGNARSWQVMRSYPRYPRFWLAKLKFDLKKAIHCIVEMRCSRHLISGRTQTTKHCSEHRRRPQGHRQCHSCNKLHSHDEGWSLQAEAPSIRQPSKSFECV